MGFPRRRYGGRVHRDTQRLRVVGLLNRETGEYHLYVTNVPAEKLAAEDIRVVYSLRRQVELFFKELKLELIPFRGRSAASVVKPLHGGISSRS